VLYALADQNDPERGWGLAGETWNFMAALERLGGETWFKLGDRDLATHVLRTQALAKGRTLSEVTALLARRLGIAHTVLPMSDDPVRRCRPTKHPRFQDYLCGGSAALISRGDVQAGASRQPRFRDALGRAVPLSSPSNPFVSIDPALRPSGAPSAAADHRRLADRRRQAVKGPLAKMMAAWRQAFRARRGAALWP
jgi:LPPG:FO 2-phospho-L-lactate transferase